MTNITPEGRLTTSSFSPAQAAYLARERFHRKRVSVLRTMLLILLLALWELGAETGAIDDFIFSSPSRVVLCFLSMAENGAILHHIGVTLY